MPCKQGVPEHANALADYLPGGRTFEAKRITGSNLRQLLVGIAHELFRAQGYITTLQQEYLPDNTNLFLDEWESALGIPDDCFSGLGTSEERLRDIILKLTAYAGIQTVADFQNLADQFDITAVVTPGADTAFPIVDPRFAIVVEWFGATPTESAQIQIVACLFEVVKPANVELYYFGLNRFAQNGEELMQCGEDFAQCNNSLF